MSGPDDRGEGTADTDHADVGLAETVSPVPGAAGAIASTQASEDPAGFAERPVSDKLQRAVARAKIAGKLFASDERVKLGRYHLLELVGSGGMGVVWGAWDPELDRRVAIKLVKATMLAARERILLEGQALAKLSHPNVVPVFDVGVVDEQVYLVMEWVRGKNLRVYCKEPRTVRDIVGVYRDAGLGLSAAHHAGLIHRDFKPDNAIRGDDGRVRVLDFGLAREGIRKEKAAGTDDTPTPSSDLTRGAGTPRYMPPEQASGGALTPSVDQYAFCVSLREALVGRDANGKDADVPGWLEQIITRGTLRDPAARYASMDELLRALARDPRTVWRRRAIVTGALGLAGATFAIGTLRGGSGPERCIGGKAEIAKTWNDEIAGKMVAHLESLGPFAKEEARRLSKDLGAYAVSWSDAHRDACLAQGRGELSPVMYERNVSCLSRANVALATVADIALGVTDDKVPDAIFAAHQLPSVERCGREDRFATIAPPPAAVAARVDAIGNDVARARVIALSGLPEAVDRAKAAVTAAEETHYLPLIAQALLVEGSAEMAHDYMAGAEALRRAMASGFEVGDNALAVEAYARYVYASSVIRSVDGLFIVEPIARHLGTSGVFSRSLLFNNAGVVDLRNGNGDAARDAFRKALVESEGARDANIELNVIPVNLALVLPAGAERERILAEAIDRFERLLGVNHPLALNARILDGLLAPDTNRAAKLVGDGCGQLVKMHPGSFDIVECQYELAWILDERGDDAGARAAMENVARIDDPEPLSKRAVASAYLETLAGHADAVRLRTLGDEFARREEWWLRVVAVDVFMIAAASARQAGRTAESMTLLRRGVPILEEVARFQSTFKRRLARTQLLLARSLSGSDRAAARDYATAALRWYRDASDPELVRELERLAAQ